LEFDSKRRMEETAHFKMGKKKKIKTGMCRISYGSCIPNKDVQGHFISISMIPVKASAM